MADVNNENPNVEENQQARENSNQQETNQQDSKQEKPEVTIESLLAENAKLKADSARNKAALDKALKEKGDITKQYREVLTEAQQAQIDKENADEEHKKYVAGLEEFKAKAEAKARYALQGMPPELAEKAAYAEISGDMDALAAIQKQNTEALIKQKEAEWLKSRPPVTTGAGDERTTVTREQFNKMGYSKRVEFKQKYPETYKSYTE